MWQALNQIELPLLLFLAQLRTETVTQFVQGFSALGSLGVALALFTLIAIYGFVKKRRQTANYGVKGILGSIGVGVLVAGLKLVFKREIPSVAVQNWAIGYGFPSGHAATAFFIASYLSFRYRKLTPYLIVYASLIGFSRMFLGAHYLTDVLAGAVIGFLIGEELSEAKIIKWMRRKIS